MRSTIINKKKICISCGNLDYHFSKKMCKQCATVKSTTGNNSQIFLCATRSSSTVFRTSVYSEKVTNPSDLKNEYSYYYNLVKREYGNPTYTYRNSAFWINEIVDVSIEVANINQIKVVYDNKINLNTKKYEEYNNQ